MSPNEAQLRAALREGAGRGVDADAIIARAEQYRRARRQRYNALAAAALVVGVLGTGGTLIALNGSDEQAGSSSVAGGNAGGAGSRPDPAQSAASAPSTAAPPRVRNGQYSTAPGVGFKGAPVAVCPATPKRVVVPAASAQDRAMQLLPARPYAIKACAYPSGAAATSATFADLASRKIATKLNNASSTPVKLSRGCLSRDESAGSFTLLVLDADRRRVKTVHVRVQCGSGFATNGTATRYFYVLPVALNHLLR